MNLTKNQNLSEDNLDVVGVGNAIVDILVHISEDFISSKNLNKGNMTLVNEDQADDIFSTMGKGLEASGGSAANTLAGIAQLGGKGGFIGRVKNDSLGKIFIRELRSTGTLYLTPSNTEGPSTARCLILVTPDAERTMCTYLGASTFLEPKDLNFDLIKNTKVLYLEGYLFDADQAKKAFYAASQVAIDNKKKVALSLSDAFCVERHRESFLNLLNSYVDIVFANETEIMALYRTNDLFEAINQIKNSCEIIIITLGAKGSIIISNGDQIKINPHIKGKVIDTTGAGDLYASGFLYGYTKKYDLKKCGNIGSICAGHIVTQLGPNANCSLIDLVREYL
tara:strand:+ start:21412 stop:22425 length:1014 start_codon:yes stop_codon:yes gene_type:complete